MLPTRLNMHKIKNWLHFIKFHEKVDKIKWPYFFDLVHIWPCSGCLLLRPFSILKYFFLKKPSTDFLKNHLKQLFYIYFIIFHRKIQSDPPKNLVAAFRQCVYWSDLAHSRYSGSSKCVFKSPPPFGVQWTNPRKSLIWDFMKSPQPNILNLPFLLVGFAKF